MLASVRMMVRTSLVALLGAALMFPAAAGAESALSTDDNDIPGATALSAPLVVGSLDAINDGDVYTVELKAGERFTAQLTGTGGTEFDLFLYDKAAVSVNDTDAPVVAETFDWYYPRFLSDSSDDTFGFVAPEDGTYFLEVYSTGGTGLYWLKWAAGAAPSVGISSSGRITYGSKKTFTGSVVGTDGTALSAQALELYALSYGGDDYKRVGTTTTAEDGTYSFSVKPTVHSYYKVVALSSAAGHSFAQSSERQVKVRIKLSKPKAPTSVYKGRYFKVYGYMIPKHKSGNHTVYIKAYHKEKQSNGTYKYVYRKAFRMTNYNSSKYPTMTKYHRKTIKLPYKGTWRLIAKAPDDGKHTTSLSAYTYLKVR
jgi:hypothetical protein